MAVYKYVDLRDKYKNQAQRTASNDGAQQIDLSVPTLTTQQAEASQAQVSQAQASLSQLAPGLTQQQLNAMKSRVASANRTATSNALAGVVGAFGGASQAASVLTARLKAGAGAQTAATMANIDVQEAQKQREMQQLVNNLNAQLATSTNVANAQMATSVSQSNASLATQVSLANAQEANQMSLAQANLKATFAGLGLQERSIRNAYSLGIRELQLKEKALADQEEQAKFAQQVQAIQLAGQYPRMVPGTWDRNLFGQNSFSIGNFLKQVLGPNYSTGFGTDVGGSMASRMLGGI